MTQFPVNARDNEVVAGVRPSGCWQQFRNPSEKLFAFHFTELFPLFLFSFLEASPRAEHKLENVLEEGKINAFLWIRFLLLLVLLVVGAGIGIHVYNSFSVSSV